MPSSLSPLAILSLLGAAHGVVLALALAGVKRGNAAANRTLAALTFTVSVFILGAVLRTTGYVLQHPHLSRIHDPFPFLAGPLLYLYLRALSTGREVFRGRTFLHFAPFLLCALYLSPYFLLDSRQKLQILLAEYQQEGLGQWYYVRSALVIAHFLVYLTLAVRVLFRYSRETRGRDSIDGAVLSQARFLVASSAVLCVLGVLRYALDRTARTNLLIPFGVSVMVYGLGYMRLRHPEPPPGAEGSPTPAPKYGKSALTPERSERYLKKLLHVMETEKPYTDGELSLQKLAERLAIPAQHLSQTINERLNQSFSDFVNGYRVEEFKRRLLDPALSHYSILALAEETGFNSKSSLNAVFKKHTNMTPSEFRKALVANGANGEH
jgi:AraC-like DNA-binding protein